MICFRLSPQEVLCVGRLGMESPRWPWLPVRPRTLMLFILTKGRGRTSTIILLLTSRVAVPAGSERDQGQEPGTASHLDRVLAPSQGRWQGARSEGEQLVMDAGITGGGVTGSAMPAPSSLLTNFLSQHKMPKLLITGFFLAWFPLRCSGNASAGSYVNQPC